MRYLIFAILFISVAILYLVIRKIEPLIKAYTKAEERKGELFGLLSRRHEYLLNKYQDEDVYEMIKLIKKERDLLKRLELEYEMVIIDDECLIYKDKIIELVKNYEDSRKAYLKLCEDNKKWAAFLNLPTLENFEAFLKAH